jgi:hypothetical protein
VVTAFPHTPKEPPVSIRPSDFGVLSALTLGLRISPAPLISADKRRLAVKVTPLIAYKGLSLDLRPSSLDALCLRGNVLVLRLDSNPDHPVHPVNHPRLEISLQSLNHQLLNSQLVQALY